MNHPLYRFFNDKHNLKLTEAEIQKVIRIAKQEPEKEKTDTFNEKFQFALEEGFKSVSHAVSVMGTFKFNQKFENNKKKCQVTVIK